MYSGSAFFCTSVSARW